MASTANQSSKIHLCEYCKKSFAKEKTLIAHMCEPKRRWLQKDDKAVVLGFWAFQRFYKLSAGSKKEKTYEDFCESSFYNAFVKFGTYLKNVQPLYTEKYIDHVVTSGDRHLAYSRPGSDQNRVTEFFGFHKAFLNI